jgi:hypothetical protein
LGLIAVRVANVTGSGMVKDMLIAPILAERLNERRPPFDVDRETVLGDDKILAHGYSWRPSLLH